DAYHYMSCLGFKALALLHLGEWGEALRISRDGTQMAQKNGHGLAIRIFQLTLAWLHELAFDFARARQLCEPLVQQAREDQADRHFGLIRLGMAYLGLGESERAVSCFRELTSRIEGGFLLDWIWHLHLHYGL